MIVFPWQKPLRGTQLNHNHPLARGLDLFYLIHEGIGDKVFDLVHGVNSVSLDYADFVVGQKGYAISANAAQTVIAPLDTEYTFLPGMSLEICWRVDALSNGYSMAFGKNDNNNYFGFNDTNDLEFQDNASKSIEWWYPSVPLGVYRTHLLCWDSTTVRGYLNGIYMGDPDVDESPTDFRIGMLLNGYNNNNYYLQGELVFLRVWDRVLTPTEAVRLYREPYAMFQQSHKSYRISVLLPTTYTKDVDLTADMYRMLGWAWGQEDTSFIEIPEVWSTWKKAGGASATYDTEFGLLQLKSGETFYSDVKDMGSSTERLLKIAVDKYGSGSGAQGTIEWRGSDSPFDWDEGL